MASTNHVDANDARDEPQPLHKVECETRARVTASTRGASRWAEGVTTTGGAEPTRGGTEPAAPPLADVPPGGGGVVVLRPPPLPQPLWLRAVPRGSLASTRARMISCTRSRVVGPTGLRGSPTERLAVIIW